MAGDMTILHNCFLRGINSIYLQCGNVATKGSTKDKLDLANFAYQWAEWVDEHHRFEEEDLFPRINELAGVPGIMDGNVNEHAQFHDGLIKFEEYLNKVKEEKEELSAETMKSIIESFMPALQSHLESEIDTLVSLEKYDDKVDWFKEYNATVDKMVKGLMAQSEYRVSLSADRSA